MASNSPGKTEGVRCEKPAFKASALRMIGISPSSSSHRRVYQYGNSTEADDFVSKYNCLNFSTRAVGLFLISLD